PGDVSFDFLLPNIGASPKYQLRGAADDGTGNAALSVRTGISLGQTGVDIAVPAPATLSSPANAATGVGFGSTLSWTGVSSGVYQVVPSVGSFIYVIYTTSTQTDLPDLTGIQGMSSLTLPAQASGTWHVNGFAPTPSLDGVAGPGPSILTASMGDIV